VAERQAWTSWSEQEKIDLVDVWSRPEGLKKNLHLFNGRSIDSILGKAHAMGLPAKSAGPANRGGPNEVLILKLLELRPMDIAELAVKLGICERPARFRVNALYAAGKIHITRWERFSPHGKPSRMWALGAGEDAPRPRPIPHKVLERKRIERMRKEDPAAHEAILARKRLMQSLRTGTLVKRDPAAAALFGPAERRPSRRARGQTDASLCA
jgi:hypothetical protein